MLRKLSYVILIVGLLFSTSMAVSQGLTPSGSSDPLITISSIAVGSPQPEHVDYPATVTNGDFLITGSERHRKVGNGIDEQTSWSFVSAQHPNFAFLPDLMSLESALLTLTLQPKAALVTTDGVKINGLPAINMTSLIQSIPVNITTTIQLELLDFLSSSDLLDVLKATPDGRLEMTYNDDSIVSFARLDISGFLSTTASSCTEIFGSAPEFALCEETATTCTFNAFTDDGTCDQMCSSFGSTCLGAMDNADSSCTPLPGNTDTCQTPRFMEICICER